MYYLLSQAKTGWYFSAMGLNFKELEFPGSDTPWIHGFPHLWWSQGSTTQVQQQAWQVTTFKSINKNVQYIIYTLYYIPPRISHFAPTFQVKSIYVDCTQIPMSNWI